MRSLSSTILGATLALSAAFTPGCSDCNGEPIIDEPITSAPDDDDTEAPQYNRGYYLDMALDSEGRPWLAFRDGERGILQVARGAGDPAVFDTVWDVDGQPDTSGPIPSGGFEGGYYASIVIDANNQPHVAHWNQEDGGLRYATLVGDAWEAEDVETGEVGQFTDIVLVDGAPLISYYDYGSGALKVARKGATGWQDETVDEGDVGPDAVAAELEAADVGLYTNLFVDGSTVWLAYYDRANGDLKVASGGFGSWSIEGTFGSEIDAGTWPTLTSDGGSVYVAFQNLSSHTLWWGTVTGGGILTEVIDEGAFTGADSSIVWDGGNAVIVYQDSQNNDAKIAVQDGAGGWTLSTHMADGAVGFHNSLEMDSSGRLNWSCFDHTRTDFVFQRFSL
ncbi:MAG: hypothetical protein KDA24_25075 [Deltaproteobacteria bacterium]|nr:hypothetical protein [Deltaproteobacteria bacterium]